MIISESDRVDVVEFVLPVDRRVTADLNPTEATDLVDDLFHAYVRDASYIRDDNYSLIPSGSPRQVAWPAGLDPDDRYECWQQWYAQVVIVDG